MDPKERSLWGDLLALGLVFPVAIVLGFLIGRWIGGRFGRPELGQWIGLGWGILTAFYELYKVTRRMAILDAPPPPPAEGGAPPRWDPPEAPHDP